MADLPLRPLCTDLGFGPGTEHNGLTPSAAVRVLRIGRESIAEAYRTQPPGGTMTITSIEVDPPDTASAVYRWASGGAGTMTIRWVDGKVAELTVAVDESARASS
jgi:hypothetical protein